MSGGKVIALVKYSRSGASSRVRIWNLAAQLRARGWEVEVIPMLDDRTLKYFYRTGKHDYFALFQKVLSRVFLFWRGESPAIWWIEKELVFGAPLFFEWFLRSYIRKAVIDYDDAVYLNYSDDRFGSVGRAAKFKHYARNAACITVGSEYLKNRMRDWGATRLVKIPSTVPVGKYPVHDHQEKDVVVIGWIGTPVTVRFLDGLRDILPQLGARVKFRLHVVGAHWECKGVDVVCLKWSEVAEAELVSGFDIGIMPLVDGPWEQAKCGYKLIQYMAAGVVPIGSRVGENRIILEEGINGYLADSQGEWLVKLEMLCRDHRLRAIIGARAREKALVKYDINCAASAMHEVFTEVLAKRNDTQSS